MDRQLREKAKMAKCSLYYLSGGQITIKFSQFFYTLENFHTNILAKKEKAMGIGNWIGNRARGEEEAAKSASDHLAQRTVSTVPVPERGKGMG